MTEYCNFLAANHYADFARLEELFLAGLRNGELSPVTDTLQAVLVDEFQDTNFLQEQIYLELCRRGNGVSLTVVGDDDQSIYRFRGATIEIFANFEQRVPQALGAGWQPNRVNLFRNYRSTEHIVQFGDTFLRDPGYQAARAPGKLPLTAEAPHARTPTTNPPVLGMFRASVADLADGLADFLRQVFRGPGYTLQCSGIAYTISRGQGGDFGDSVLLARTVRERTLADQPRDRLPLLLRQRLEAGPTPVRVFNPRGRSLGDLEDVQRVLGLALECIDPNATIQQAITSMPQADRNRLTAWRAAAQQFMGHNPSPGGLAAFVQGWQSRSTNVNWPRDWPLLELMFTLATWFPQFQTDPEGQVYLEAVTRTVAEVGQMAAYRALIFRGAGVHDDRSVHQAIREVFENIASESIDIDEEIMPRVPRSYFPMMTIHQAKGLEFPLTIVDAGSDYAGNYAAQRPFRFPQQGANVHVREDDVGPYSPIGAARALRNATDRAWDDLRRLYFVAYSRPENVLMLVGLTSVIRQNPIRCIACGDCPDGSRSINFIQPSQFTANTPASNVVLI